MPTALSSGDFAAMHELSKARQMAVHNIFCGTKLVFGSVEQAKTAKTLHTSAKNIKKSCEGVANATSSGGGLAAHQLRKTAAEFIKSCADVDDINDIVDALTSDVVNDLIAEVTPFIGILKSGAKAVMAGKAVVQDGRALYKSRIQKTGFRAGDPLAAAEAVIVLIKRDLAKDSVNLAKHSTATGGKIAGLALDAGTATTATIGLCNAVATLGLELFALGLEIKEMRAGNKRLANPATLDLTVFADCPILGCYLLTCADTSTVANFFIADMGLPGWMDKIEQIKKKKMEPMLSLATKDIEKSRLQLSGLQSNKGTFAKKSFFAKVKSQAMKRIGLA
jgi:hypothetical protein